MSNIMTKYKVVEIFDSIDGEGIRTGQPVSFIRLAGCNLRCSYCDTLYSLFGEDIPCDFTEMTAGDILSQMNPLYKRITLTGGEPLAAPQIHLLVQLLLDNGYEVNIETNGAVDIVSFMSKLTNYEKLFFTIDYKLPSSNMSDRMLFPNFLALRQKDVIKFVVGSDRDAEFMLDIVKKLQKELKAMPHIFIGAVYKEFDLEKLTALILTHPELADARVQIQLHKIIWDPDKRGV